MSFEQHVIKVMILTGQAYAVLLWAGCSQRAATFAAFIVFAAYWNGRAIWLAPIA